MFKMKNEKIINQLEEKIQTKVIAILDKNVTYTDDDYLEHIRTVAMCETENSPFDIETKSVIIKRVFNTMRRYDLIQDFVEDSAINEIMINGCDNIFIDRNNELIESDVRFPNQTRLNNLIQKIVSPIDRKVNAYTPIVDARLADGSRVNIVLKPIALNGPIVTIRKFRNENITLEQMVEGHCLSSAMFHYLVAIIRQRKNVFICGGTSSGKTTLLNALSEKIDVRDRVITIEDSAELKIKAIKNIVTLETRENKSNAGNSVTLSDLIIASLRMRPDRIIIGEVRGPEAFYMLQAMNTGHSGSISTGHSNSSKDMISRLEMMVLMCKDISVESVKKQITSALDIILFIKKCSDGTRRITEICEIDGDGNSDYNLKKCYWYEDELGFREDEGLLKEK